MKTPKYLEYADYIAEVFAWASVSAEYFVTKGRKRVYKSRTQGGYGTYCNDTDMEVRGHLMTSLLLFSGYEYSSQIIY